MLFAAFPLQRQLESDGDVEIDAAGADRDDAVQKFRAPPRKPRSTASFAPSHATPPPYLRHE